MIAPIHSFDVNAINAGMQHGMMRGGVNSPVSGLDRALKAYDMHKTSLQAAQAEQQGKMNLLGAQNSMDSILQDKKYGYEADIQRAKMAGDMELQRNRQEFESSDAGMITMLDPERFGIKNWRPGERTADNSMWDQWEALNTSKGRIVGVPRRRPVTGAQIGAVQNTQYEIIKPNDVITDVNGSILPEGFDQQGLDVLNSVLADMKAEREGR